MGIKSLLGLILLILGVLMIIWGLWQSYFIFNAKKEVPQVFTIVDEAQEREASSNLSPEEKIGKEIQEVIGQEFSKVFSSEFVARIFNLTSWVLFMFILIYAGGKLAFIGVRLLK